VLQTDAAFICSPFKAQIMLQLQPTPKFSENVKCTLDSIVDNIDDFYNDFSKGGWIGYAEVMKPQNNYYGVALQVSANLNAQAAKAVDAASKEVQAGSGFLSVKRCKGGGISAEGEGLTGYVKDSKGNYCFSDEMENITPGDAVGEAVKTAINSDSQWAANVQSYTAALINAFINRLIKEGISELQPSSSDSSYGGTVGAQLQTVSAQLQQDKNQMISEINKFVDEWQYVLDRKKESVIYARKISNCGPMIIESNIQAAQAEVIRLQSEIADLESRISKANVLIDDIKKADFNDVNQRSLAQSSFLDFSNKYNTQQYLLPIVSGSGKQNSDTELKNKQKDWADLEQGPGGVIDCNLPSINI